MKDLRDLHAEWSEAFPRYDALVKWAADMLQAEAREVGLDCYVEGRAKEMSSFLKKCLKKKDKYADPVQDMPDKAGVRVVLFCRDGRPLADKVIQKLFNVSKIDDQGTDEEDVFGYAAVHYDVVAPESSGTFAGMRFEIQVHNEGQHLWSKVSHKLAYKGVTKPDKAVMRRIHRLAALLEIFDQDVESTRNMILANPSYKGSYALSVLGRHFMRLTGVNFDQELSVQVLDALGDFIPAAETDQFDSEMGKWVAENRPHLETVFTSYRDDPHKLLLFQPEGLLIFKLLGDNPFKLEAAWRAKDLPWQLLSEMGDVWGVPVHDGT
jgi:ppGpp synthetase/RelA/SpoT-type nucleotidyltranferase